MIAKNLAYATKVVVECDRTYVHECAHSPIYVYGSSEGLMVYHPEYMHLHSFLSLKSLQIEHWIGEFPGQILARGK